MLIPAPSDLVDHLTSASDPVERAVLCNDVAVTLMALRSLAMDIRSGAMLEAYEHHGATTNSLAAALGITPARALTVVTEARRARDLRAVTQ